MQHHAKEKSKGAAKKGKPGWHRGRNDPKKGSQGDEEMELVGSLMKKCLNPLILPANNGGALNWEARAASKDPLPRGLAWRRGLYQPERERRQRGAGCWLRVSGSACGLDGGWASLVASVPRCFGRRRWAPCACKLPSTACPSPVLAGGAARTRRARPACGSARACCQRRYGSVLSTAAPIVRIPRVARLDTKSCCGW